MRLHGQAVKTSPFHGGNPGSIPGGVTKKIDGYNFVSVYFLADSRRGTDAEQHSPSPLYPVSSDAFVLAELCDTHAICRFSRTDLLSQSPGGVTRVQSLVALLRSFTQCTRPGVTRRIIGFSFFTFYIVAVAPPIACRAIPD